MDAEQRGGWARRRYNKQLDGSTVHLTNVARTQFFDKHIERRPRAGRAKWVLEVGTGDGVVAEALAFKGYKVTAVDTALPFLEVRSRLNSLHGKQSERPTHARAREQ